MAGVRVAADLRGGGSMTASPVMRADLELSARRCRRPLVPVRRTWFLVGVVGENPVRAAVGGDCLRVPDDPPWPCGQTGCLWAYGRWLPSAPGDPDLAMNNLSDPPSLADKQPCGPEIPARTASVVLTDFLGLGCGSAIAAQPGTVIRRIWPSPGAGPPKPRLDTYSAPSGPRVIAVGNDSPVAITVCVPEG